MLMALLGFFGGFLPEILKLFNRWQDNKHELEMFKLQMQAQSQMHRDELETINVQADVATDVLIHQPIPSYGVPFLDKMAHAGYSAWLMIPLLYLYTALDVLQVIVRPGITLAITAFYMWYKYAQYVLFQTTTGPDDWFQNVLALYSDFDRDILVLVLSYWFGSRMAQKSLGTSSQNNGWRG